MCGYVVCWFCGRFFVVVAGFFPPVSATDVQGDPRQTTGAFGQPFTYFISQVPCKLRSREIQVQPWAVLVHEAPPFIPVQGIIQVLLTTMGAEEDGLPQGQGCCHHPWPQDHSLNFQWVHALLLQPTFAILLHCSTRTALSSKAK